MVKQLNKILNQEDLEQYNKGGCTHTLVVEGRYCRIKRLPNSPWRYCSRHTKMLDYHIHPIIRKGCYDKYDNFIQMLEVVFKDEPELIKKEENYTTFIVDYFSKKREMEG